MGKDRYFYVVADFFQALVPLSMRGLLVLLILCYLFLNPIWNRSDIVATVLGVSLLGLIVLLTIINALSSYSLKRSLNPQLIIPTHSEGRTDDGMVAGAPNVFLLSVGPLSIPPLFVFSLELDFEQTGVSSACHMVTQRIRPSEPLSYRIVFPHRGRWRLAAIRCVLEDRFGFSSSVWLDMSHSDLRVAIRPDEITTISLPVISSSVRSGDDMSHHTERMGEPFDLKPYQPSDGIKKILWKVFAKRGELIARHPEHAVTPEGHVIGYVLARPGDDSLAAWSLAYFTKLKELHLTMEVGCLGMAGESFARSPEQLRELLISSAFRAPTTITGDEATVIQAALANSRSYEQSLSTTTIAIFMTDSTLYSDKGAREIIDLLHRLQMTGIEPVICLQRTINETSLPKRSSLVRQLFLSQPRKFVDMKPFVIGRNTFLNGCSMRHLKVYQEPFSTGGIDSHA